MGIIHRVRAFATTALVWGGMYALAGAVFNLMQTYWGSAAPEFVLALEQTRWVAFRWAVIGVISGSMFAAAFSRFERRRTFSQLSLPRVALWGVVGGMALPLLNSALILAGVVHESVGIGTLMAHTMFGAMLGSACATAWFSIARGGSDSIAQQAALQSGLSAGSLPSGGAAAKVPWSRRGLWSWIPRV